MKHANHLLLEKIYSDFDHGKFESIMEACDPKITFNVPGKSTLAGKYDRSNFITSFLVKLKEISNGTFKTEVHDILANDRHAVVLASDTLTQSGQKSEYRTVHVWRFENGKPVAWYEYPRDLYQYDAIFGK